MTYEHPSRLAMPEAVEGRMVPTLNGFGYMTMKLDPLSEQFARESRDADLPVLEIGAAYGNVALQCLSHGARVHANDIDPRHLDILQERAEKAGLGANLTLRPGSFPDDVSLPDGSLSLVLACRVLHFFDGDAFPQALQTVHRSLAPGGKFFVVLDTPFNDYFGAMIPPFLQRKKLDDRWPGLFVGKELPQYIPGYNLDLYPNVYNLFDADSLHAALVEAGFKVDHIDYIARPDYLREGQMDGRECVGAIAVKV